MKLLILLVCLPAWVLAQEPVKPVVSSVNYQGADISALSKNIADITTQIKGIADAIKAARAQIQLMIDQRSKLSSDLAAKKNARKDLEAGSAAADQLDRQIKDLETKIAELNKKITAQQEFIDRQHTEIGKLRDAIDKLEGKIDELQARESKKESTKAKNEAAASYTKLKLLLDSLPAAEKAKFTAAETKTLSFYQNLYEKDVAFKTAMLAARLQAQKDQLDVLSEESKEKIQASKDAMKAMMEMIRKYLETLAAIQSRVGGAM